MIHFPLLRLILLPTLTPLLRVRRMDTAAMTGMMKKVVHEPRTYASHRQGLIPIMERVLQIASISQGRVKLSTQVKKIHSCYTRYTSILVVMHDHRMPGFPGEMVTGSGVLLTTAIQSAAREMTKRIIAWFWNPKFMTNE